MGVLHQAVWWCNEDILKKLLRMPACDSRVQTKETMSEIGETSACTPYEVAKKYEHKDIETLLEKHSTKKATEDELLELPTFHYQNSDVQLLGLGLLRITLASYRQTLCPFTISNKPLSDVMEQIFRYIDTNDNWLTVKTKICDSLYTVCTSAVTVLKATETKENFYSKIVNVYTNESTQLYMYLNTALRRQEERAYTPTAKDLGLGPYILMFHLLLMHWKKLAPEKGITYRRMLVKDSDCSRYQKGTQFIWLSFVSSSVDLSKAEPFPTCVSTGEHQMTFIIDNRSPSRWRPRNIENHAEYVERERVYPAGGEFLVTDRTENDGTTEVRLKLLDRGLASAQSAISKKKVNVGTNRKYNSP